MFPSYYEYYKGSLVMTEGRMQYLFDHRGTRYLDLIGGISSIAAGHCHPRITAALQKQA